MRAKAFTGLVVLIIGVMLYLLFLFVSGVVFWFRHKDERERNPMIRSQLLGGMAACLALEFVLGFALIIVVLIYKGIV